MESGSTISELTTAQLVAFLTQHGVSHCGVDSVWEKEVTGSMLSQFCEEDIKDVFTEFKDRFLIRKILREIDDRQTTRHRPAATLVPPSSASLCVSQAPKKSSVNHSCALSSGKLQDTKPSLTQHLSPLNQCTNTFVNQPPTLATVGAPQNKSVNRISVPTVIEVEDDDDKEIKFLWTEKKAQPTDIPRIQKIPQAHANFQVHSSNRCNQQSVGDSHLLPSMYSAFMNKPPIRTNLPSDQHQVSVGYNAYNASTADTKLSDLSSTSQAEQALCLKISSAVSQMHPRNETPSPAAQPSSTTPDSYTVFETGQSDCMAMCHLASKYTAYEILSKKAQRSRPNSAQKLGSILVRNAALDANLWSAPPHLRSISARQRLKFLSYVYRVAPHIREYEHLLWQRLSEMLQNRRKYLLDKKLGKRGVRPDDHTLSSSELLPDFNSNVTLTLECDNFGETSDGTEYKYQIDK